MHVIYALLGKPELQGLEGRWLELKKIALEYVRLIARSKL